MCSNNEYSVFLVQEKNKWAAAARHLSSANNYQSHLVVL